MSVGVRPAVATPSMSFGVRPQSAMAFSAASACMVISEMFGVLPRSVVSAAPTMAMVFGRIDQPSAGRNRGNEISSFIG